jgi:predicted metal-binding protein
MIYSTITTEELKSLILSCGAEKAAVIQNDSIVLSADFREICRSNACGNYGQCYMCPPDVGGIKELMRLLRTFDTAILYQSVYALEDSFDFEGMQEAGKAFNRMSRLIHEKAQRILTRPFLHLAAGGCGFCETCAKRENLPCREPEHALPSLEAYGVDVYRTSANAGLKYINGADTVTYFGMLLV